MSTVTVKLSNIFYSKDSADKVIDRSFQEFGQKEDDVEVLSVEKFFQDYEDLFYQIAATGSVQSHQYLVEKSSQMYSMDRSMEDIQMLVDEITSLKMQSVADQQTILELNSRIAELSGTAGN